MQAKLWDKIRCMKFEDIYAFKDLNIQEALDKLNYAIYFDLKKIPIPSNQEQITYYMLEENILEIYLEKQCVLFSTKEIIELIYVRNTQIPKVTMYSKCNFTEMLMDDKVWSCYLHACVKQVNGESITNASLRERFGVDQKLFASVSRLIKESIERGLIRPLDASTAPKHMKYVPTWA